MVDQSVLTKGCQLRITRLANITNEHNGAGRNLSLINRKGESYPVIILEFFISNGGVERKGIL